MAFWGDLNNFFHHSKDDPSATEQTMAPKNIDPMSFDITAKTPLMEIIPDEFLQPPPEVQDIISELVDSLSTTAVTEPSTNDNYVTPSITIMDFSDEAGHTLVKITEDITGKAINVLHEATTLLPTTTTSSVQPTTIGDIATTVLPTTTSSVQSTTIGDIATAITDNLNDLSSPEVIATPKHDEIGSGSIYVIAALVLLMLICLSVGVIFWCRRYKLKAVKKNGDYPVTCQHLNNQMLSNTEKLKNMP